MSHSLKNLLLVAGCTLPLFLSGCALETTAVDGGTSITLTGMVHGGPSPIIGATINLYATQSNGYGGAGLLLKSTTTGADGSFSFTRSSYTCPAGQQAYVTATGGNTGGNASNPNSLLMLAIGPCANLTQNSYLLINEATTVAAAYAVGNFTTLSGTTVNVSAPANNNVATPACTLNGNGTSTCQAAGLTHAFQNAANLVAVNGLVNSVAPSNPSSQIPNALINTIADVLQACVNSLGGVAGDNSTPCGFVFSDTTPPTTSTASPVTPTNTLQAALNLAKYPTLTPANVTDFFGRIGTNGFFQPTLTAAPSDYSIAIIWSGVTVAGTTTPYKYPFFLTLDNNDNVYSVNQASSSAGPTFPAAMSSNGTPLWLGTSFATGTCAAAQPCVASTDAVNHLWVPTNSTSLYEVSTTNGSPVSTFTITGATPNSTVVSTLR